MGCRSISSGPASMRLKPLSRSFFEPSARDVAPALLGHWLLRETSEGVCGGLIVETEAYLQNDPACHAFIGKTSRNQVMFGSPGHAYVYFIYGMHFCVNAVCLPPGLAEAVLIRAVEPLIGLEILKKNRPVARLRDISSGPAKLCDAMAIDRSLDGADLCSSRSALKIAENTEVDRYIAEHGPVVTTTRIGITQAASFPLRFYLSRNVHVSAKLPLMTSKYSA
jgi:DNA-3-methyladenine glycosylase